MNTENNIESGPCAYPRVSLRQMAISVAWLATTTAFYVATLIALKHNPRHG